MKAIKVTELKAHLSRYRGTQKWSALKISTIRRHVDIQAALRDIREDPSEIRRR